MNKKVSGGQSVIVPINRIGKNYLPFVESLKDRVIKYIDVYTGQDTLPDGRVGVGVDISSSYITLADKNGVTLNYLNYPLENLSTYTTMGDRPFIGRKISLQNSYINVTAQTAIGKSILLVFWYDEPEFSYRNTTNNIAVETVEVDYRNANFKNLMPDNRNLAGKRVRRITFDNVNKTPSYRDCQNNYGGAYITLNNGNVSILKQVPLECLKKSNTLNAFELEFANIKFDLTNSFIEKFGDNAFLANSAWLVRFAYEN